jgi:hypothetical protein
MERSSMTTIPKALRGETKPDLLAMGLISMLGE